MQTDRYRAFLLNPRNAFGYASPAVLDRIAEMTRLQDGWHFGKGIVPSSAVLAISTQLASKAISGGLSELDAFPGKSGEVTVVIYRGDEDHSFQIRSDATIRYWNEANPDSEIEEGLSFGEALRRINSLNKRQWNSSYLSTPNTGIPNAAGSAAKPSTTQATGVAYPLSNTIASSGAPTVVSVFTLEDFIQQLAPNLQSSGDSTNPFCQMATC